jgi:hypothetical protein
MSHLSGLTCRPVVRYDCTSTLTPRSSSFRKAKRPSRSTMLAARDGQVILVPAEVPHKFMNLSDKQLKQIDIHVSKQFVTDWLEE